MKKTSKILVLLLSVALAITALVIAVSADTTHAVAETGGATYATLEAALDAATSEEGDGYVKLIADTTISQTYSVSKSVTLDLSGFTLNTVLDGFNVSGATVFTVKGAGAINCSSWFVTVQSGEGVPVVDVIGTDVGIKVQAVGGQFISAASGEITVKNVDIVSGPTPSQVGIFDNAEGSVAVYKLICVTVNSTENASSMSYIVNLSKGGTLVADNCELISNKTVIGVGSIEYAEGVKAIVANNCYFASICPDDGVADQKGDEVGVIGLYSAFSGKAEFNNSTVEGSFRAICVNAKDTAEIVFNNSKFIANNLKGGNFVRTCNVILNSGSVIASDAIVTFCHDAAETEGLYLVLKEGVRMNREVYRTIYDAKYLPNNIEEMKYIKGLRFGEDVVGEDGSVTTTLYNPIDNDKFAVIFDPVTNLEFPYVIVKRTYETAENGDVVETTPKGLDDSAYVYFSTNAALATSTLWSNGAYVNSNKNNLSMPHRDFLGWNPNNVLSGQKYNGNGAIKLTRDELNASKNNTTLVFGDGSSYAHKDYQVMVVDFDFGTDSPDGLLGGSFCINTRGKSNGGDYAGAKLNLVDGVATALTGGEDVAINEDGWNHVTIVVYCDKGNEGTSYKGQVHYYVNGTYVGYGNAYNIKGDKGNIAYLWGMRFDATSPSYSEGASIVFDNQMFRVYTDYQDATEIETDGSTRNPLSYAYNGAMPTNTGSLKTNIKVGASSFATVDEALAFAAQYGTMPVLTANVTNQKVTTEGSVAANGFTIGMVEGSYSANVKFDKDGNPAVYDFKQAYGNLKVTYEWFIGNINVTSELYDPSKYLTTEVSLGSVPVYPGEILTVTKKVGRDFYTSNHIGWSSEVGATEIEELAPVTVSSAINNSGTPIKMFPVFSEYTKQDFSKYKYIVLDAKGNFNRGGTTSTFYGSDWTTRAGTALKLEYGETLVLVSSSITWVGSFNSLRTATGVDKVFNFDLNGYTMKIDGAVNNTGKTPNYFKVMTGETINFYSSVPGAEVYVTGANDSASSVRGGTLFRMDGSGLNTVEDNIKDDTNNNAHLNVGTVTRFGETYPGSNLTIYGDTLVEANNGDATCTVNIDGINFVKIFHVYGSIIQSHYYNGNFSITNSNFFIPNGGSFLNSSNKGITDIDGDGDKDKDDVAYWDDSGVHLREDAVRVTADVLVDGCFIFVRDNGGSTTYTNVSGGDYGFGKVLYKNTVTNGRIGGSNTGLAFTIGENCCVLTPQVTFYDNVSKQYYYGDMTIGNTGLKTITVKYVSDFTKTSATKLTYIYTDYTFAVPGAEGDTVLPNFTYKFVTAENTFNVTFNDKDGNVIDEKKYAVGGTVKAPDVADINVGSIISYVATGEFTPALDKVTADVTYTPVYEAKANVTGLTYNLTLQSDFTINLFIPAEYKSFVSAVKNGETALEMKDVTTADGSFVTVSVGVAADSAANEVVFAIEITENDVTVTETVTVSIAKYAETILKNESSEYTDADRQLLWYVVNYANEAAKYFGGEENEALAALLTTYADAKGESTDRVYENALETLGLAAAFSGATLKLDAAPAYVFTVKAGFAGTVTVTTSKGAYTFTVEASDADTELVIEGMKAYEFAEIAAVTVSGTIGDEAVDITDGRYNLATFAAYHAQNAETNTASAEALDLINALYDYVVIASSYTNG